MAAGNALQVGVAGGAAASAASLSVNRVSFAVSASPAAGPSRAARYAALGDSYSSGEGNPPFDRKSGKCHRSPAGWPRIIARRDPRIAMAAHLACSGATSRALRHRYNGERPQLRALASLRRPVDLVTITIGGNDVGFGPILTDCFVSDCALDGTLARGRVHIERRLPRRLSRDYRGLKRAAPSARIVVVGYPRLFPTRQDRTVGCPWLSRRERVTLNRLAVLLDRTIARSARRAGLAYVSVLPALRGHELCTRDSWVYPLGPLGGQRRAHPLRPGQQAMANIIQPRLDALL